MAVADGEDARFAHRAIAGRLERNSSAQETGESARGAHRLDVVLLARALAVVRCDIVKLSGAMGIGPWINVQPID